MTSTELGPPEGGRTIQLNDDLQARIVTVVKAGSYLKVAAQYVGVGESTLRSWLTRGRKAALQRDRHDPEHVYCPNCDHDRTEDVRELDELNEWLRVEYEEAHATWAAAVAELVDDAVRPEEPGQTAGALNQCPQCHTDEQPQPFELEANDARCLAFLEAVTRAEADAEVFAATAWRSKFTEDWRAARDYLVRRHPERWAATTRVQISSEEAEHRISTAVDAALTSLGVDFDSDRSGLPDDLLGLVSADEILGTLSDDVRQSLVGDDPAEREAEGDDDA